MCPLKLVWMPCRECSMTADDSAEWDLHRCGRDSLTPSLGPQVWNTGGLGSCGLKFVSWSKPSSCSLPSHRSCVSCDFQLFP